ncbi:hypothetical protein QYE76_068460 [Lolium multiflorum]|uniref:Pantoate--beta-alanine ligase n=1 Tax=Lolium multiflorum TaxID=4521 RepID=A0AAD8SGS4_LOLMU|nr:hypothetical protein QYE76_068460 [Lolium multiflorum]
MAAAGEPEVIRDKAAMRAWSRRRRAEGKTVVLVPTMGFLHEGHLSLVSAAATASAGASVAVVVSIYVNPSQFAPTEDLATYPSDLAGDLRKLASTGAVHAVFNPPDLYVRGTSGSAGAAVSGSCLEEAAGGHETWIRVERLELGLCGSSRPVFFRGVTTVVSKLFNVVEPDIAVFGKKDYQQWRLICRMIVRILEYIRVEKRPRVAPRERLGRKTLTPTATPTPSPSPPPACVGKMPAGRWRRALALPRAGAGSSVGVCGSPAPPWRGEAPASRRQQLADACRFRRRQRGWSDGAVAPLLLREEAAARWLPLARGRLQVTAEMGLAPVSHRPGGVMAVAVRSVGWCSSPASVVRRRPPASACGRFYWWAGWCLDGGHGCGFPYDARRAVAVVVVTSPCWLLGSCVGFLSELYGVSGAGGLLSCSRLAHPSACGTQASWRRLGRVQPFGHTPDTGGVGAPCGLGCALPFDYVDDAVPWLGLG